MKQLENQIPIALMCRHFGVSSSGYYSWRKGPATMRKTRQMFLIAEIQRLFVNSKKTYGSPRIFQELSKKGHSCSENTIAKLMRELGLTGDQKKKFKVVTTDSNHTGPIAARVFKIEDFMVKGPNEIYAGDITYIALGDKFLYLSVVIDLFSRRVVGWSMDQTLESKGVIDALKMAYAREGSNAGVIFHSDRGVQYASNDFRELLEDKQAVPSMSRKGNCYDNAFAETFFKTIKSELIYRQEFDSEKELRSAIFEYIETWYNRKRLHSSLGYLSPVEYELINKPAA
jgi:transposase InsO family protein